MYTGKHKFPIRESVYKSIRSGKEGNIRQANFAYSRSLNCSYCGKRDSW